MLIAGAKGFAKEILEILHQNNQLENLVFYDDINTYDSNYLFDKFRILNSDIQAQEYFKTIDNKFTVGIGNPALRNKLNQKFTDLGGVLVSTISKYAEIGSYNVNIRIGCNILSGVKISNDVTIGKANIIYYNSVITHDVVVGDFCEISPSVNILGNVIIGDYCKIGTGAILFPNVILGHNVVVGAGAVVRESFPSNVTVAGVPAKIIKTV